ncbi:hypothetical protein BDZ89DRAFT_1166060 [Hymenopellis radicata]|nr:hypothetical protein BDZ89DRAFT_1166060 [Hymenopellis radicata]
MAPKTRATTRTFKEVFPETLPACATPLVYNTVVDNHVAPFYSLGWLFEEWDLHCHFYAQSEWDGKTYNAMCDSQTAWVNPRWRRYAKELPHCHRPKMHFMPNGDALYQITINFPTHMETFEEFREQVIDAAVEVLRVPQNKASELTWYRVGPSFDNE